MLKQLAVARLNVQSSFFFFKWKQGWNINVKRIFPKFYIISMLPRLNAYPGSVLRMTVRSEIMGSYNSIININLKNECNKIRYHKS